MGGLCRPVAGLAAAAPGDIPAWSPPCASTDTSSHPGPRRCGPRAAKAEQKLITPEHILRIRRIPAPSPPPPSCSCKRQSSPGRSAGHAPGVAEGEPGRTPTGERGRSALASWAKRPVGLWPGGCRPPSPQSLVAPRPLALGRQDLRTGPVASPCPRVSTHSTSTVVAIRPAYGDKCLHRPERVAFRAAACRLIDRIQVWCAGQHARHDLERPGEQPDGVHACRASTRYPCERLSRKPHPPGQLFLRQAGVPSAPLQARHEVARRLRRHRPNPTHCRAVPHRPEPGETSFPARIQSGMAVTVPCASCGPVLAERGGLHQGARPRRQRHREAADRVWPSRTTMLQPAECLTRHTCPRRQLGLRQARGDSRGFKTREPAWHPPVHRFVRWSSTDAVAQRLPDLRDQFARALTPCNQAAQIPNGSSAAAKHPTSLSGGQASLSP